MTKIGKIRDVLTKPDMFFSELSWRGVNLIIPAGIVLISALADAIISVMIISTIMRRLPGDMVQSGIDTAALIIGELIIWFAFWFVVAAIFYTI
ncbi:MAG: hypothetical protein EF813_10385 [Methanosarcinales archaeon]|nr:MAG: hypothetical protein EF813_10385 [Methanosarcinales archaeon]